MRKLYYVISGIFLGLTPFLVSSIIAIAFYASFPNWIGIAICCVLAVISGWIGVKIFKRTQITGPIEVMTVIRASPDLDNLKQEPGSETKRRDPKELAELISRNENLLRGGAFRIYGDWFGEPYDNFHEFESAQFSPGSNLLTLNFRDGEKLEIYQPSIIFEARTFLKIQNAKRIRLSFLNYNPEQNKEIPYYLDYQKEENKIVTDTNVDWYKPVFYTSLGDPALMIYG
ncbi:hypothetical protein [Halocola ammonii]